MSNKFGLLITDELFFFDKFKLSVDDIVLSIAFLLFNCSEHKFVLKSEEKSKQEKILLVLFLYKFTIKIQNIQL